MAVSLAPFETGTVLGLSGSVDIRDIPWTPHSSFSGVFMKHLIRGNQTEGRFSSHIVNLSPDAILDTHAHPGSWELHEVMAGEGSVTIDALSSSYSPGVRGIIPQGVAHRVVAGRDGLVLLATFFPALL